MNERYNIIAGQSLERISALNDGVFSIAMTLLVLDLRVPAAEAITSERHLQQALAALAPRIIPYLMTFMTLGIFWVGQQTQINNLKRGNRNYSWIMIAYLLAVSPTPFSTALLAQYITYRTALIIYWLNILLLGLMLYAGWAYANRAGLVASETSAAVRDTVYRRIVIAQLLYGFGAILCVVNTYLSIGFIVLVQLNYAIAPRLRRTAQP